jgi:ribonuclease P protein component
VCSDTGFSRQKRLRSPEEFKRVFDEACRTSIQGLVILSRPNDLGFPRLGLAVSRKHARHAVTRNRVKRQVRESFRQHQSTLGGRDFVVLARAGIELATNLRTELDSHWGVHIQRCAKSSSL